MQICACLRSALSIEELSDHAFSAWSVLVSSLHEEELEPLIDQTFSIVIRYWDAFNYQSKKTAEELIGYILRSHSGLVHTNFSTIPSLASIPALSALESEISKMKEKMDVRSQLSAFGRRCQSENAAVVEQALRELLPCLSRHEEFLHESVLSEQPDPVVAQLTRSLLDCCVKFNAGSDSITLLSAQCLGLVGCLDPNRVDPVKDKRIFSFYQTSTEWKRPLILYFFSFNMCWFKPSCRPPIRGPKVFLPTLCRTCSDSATSIRPSPSAPEMFKRMKSTVVGRNYLRLCAIL